MFVLDRPEAPYNITISPNTVAENTLPGTRIGKWMILEKKTMNIIINLMYWTLMTCPPFSCKLVFQCKSSRISSIHFSRSVSGRIIVSDEDTPISGYIIKVASEDSPFYVLSSSLYVLTDRLDHETAKTLPLQIKVQEISSGRWLLAWKF